jgi:ribonuclease HII
LCFNLEKFPNESFLKTINDSKKIPERKREEIFHEIIRLSNLEIPEIYF